MARSGASASHLMANSTLLEAKMEPSRCGRTVLVRTACGVQIESDSGKYHYVGVRCHWPEVLQAILGLCQDVYRSN